VKKKTDQQKTTAKRKQCVTIAKLIARKKAGYRCEYVDENGIRCNRGEPNYQTHGSHIKCEHRHRGMSADIDNIQCHCAGHHTGMGNVTPNWHKDPLLMVMLFAKRQPERAEELNLRSQKAIKVNWDKRLVELKKELDKLKETQ
jgi:hypothetical protein